MMAGRRADSDRCGSGAGRQRKDLACILRCTKQVGTLNRNQCQMTPRCDSCCSTRDMPLWPDQRAAHLGTEGIAHAHGNVTRCDRDERAWMQHLCTKPGE